MRLCDYLDESRIFLGLEAGDVEGGAFLGAVLLAGDFDDRVHTGAGLGPPATTSSARWDPPRGAEQSR